jgi:hypothetical protein
MAVVLILVQTKKIGINIHKRNITKTHSTKQLNTSIYITKTPPHTLTHTLQNELKQPQYMIHTKWNGGQVPSVYGVPNVHDAFVPKNFTVTYCNSKQNNFTQITLVHSHHYPSHHLTYLHSVPTWIPLLVTTILSLFLYVFVLQGKDVSKPAGNWFQLLMVLFTKEYLPPSVPCFLVLILRLWSFLLR